MKLRFERLRIDTSTSRERAWLVGAVVATRHECQHALESDQAARWIHSYARGVSRDIVDAVRQGEVLLNVEWVGPQGVDQAGPDAVNISDLADLAEAEPLADEAVPAEPVEPAPQTTHEVEVQVVNVQGEPQAGVAYELTLPDGTVLTGRTDPNGMVLHQGLQQTGQCQLTFPELVQQQQEHEANAA